MRAELPEASRGLALAYDVADVAQVREMFGRLDRLDVLVNCAGVTGWLDLGDPSEETWDRVIDTNLKGTFFCSIEAARLMRAAGGGSIVNVSSVVALAGAAEPRGLRREQGRDQRADHPARGRARRGRDPRQRLRARRDERRAEPRRRSATTSSRWAPLIPLGRVAEPEEMVGPAVFFASDDRRT